MNVKKWISYKKAESYKKIVHITGLGGWLNYDQKGLRWKDYLKVYDHKAHPYLEAIRQSVLENNIRITGEQHQYGPNGVPLFEDNRVAIFSYRGWGDLMAAIWSDAEDKDYSYTDFYM